MLQGDPGKIEQYLIYPSSSHTYCVTPQSPPTCSLDKTVTWGMLEERCYLDRGRGEDLFGAEMPHPGPTRI